MIASAIGHRLWDVSAGIEWANQKDVTDNARLAAGPPAA